MCIEVCVLCVRVRACVQESKFYVLYGKWGGKEWNPFLAFKTVIRKHQLEK